MSPLLWIAAAWAKCNPPGLVVLEQDGFANILESEEMLVDGESATTTLFINGVEIPAHEAHFDTRGCRQDVMLLWKCSDGTSGTEFDSIPGRECGEGPDWQVVVGGAGVLATAAGVAAAGAATLAVAGAAGAVAAKLMKPTYILQLSTNKVELTGDADTADVDVAVWQVSRGGAPIPVPNAAIALAISGTGFTAAPTHGAGQMRVTITRMAGAKAATGTISVRATAAGTAKAAAIAVRVGPALQIRPTAPHAAWSRREKAWDSPAIRVGDFEGVAKRKIDVKAMVAIPPVLGFDPPVPDGAGAVRVGTTVLVDALDKHLGPDLDRGGGRVEIRASILCDGVTATLTTSIFVCATVAVRAWPFTTNPSEEKTHEYRAIPHKSPWWLLADAWRDTPEVGDALPFAAIPVRADLLDQGRLPPEPEKAVFRHGSLEYPAVDKGFTAEPHPVHKAGVVRPFWLRSDAPRPWTGQERPVTLKLTPRRLVGGPANILLDDPTEIRVEVSDVYLKLFVHPGTRYGCSEAAIFVSAAPSNTPLGDTEVIVEVTCLGAARLGVDGLPSKRTEKVGDATFDLRYSGLTWKTVGDARFEVRAGLGSPLRAPKWWTRTAFSVGENLAAFLKAMIADAPSMNLHNFFFDRNHGWVRSLNGPANNILHYLGVGFDAVDMGAKKAAEKVWGRAYDGPKSLTDTFFVEFTCGQMRDRLMEWALNRRATPDMDRRLRMNGLDFRMYEIAPIHVFFGFHLCGDEDPWFIDPWWDQQFDPDKVAMGWTDEFAKLGGTVLLLLDLALILVAVGAAPTIAGASALVWKWIAGALFTVGTGTQVTYSWHGFGFHAGETPRSDQWQIDASDETRYRGSTPKALLFFEIWLRQCRELGRPPAVADLVWP